MRTCRILLFALFVLAWFLTVPLRAADPTDNPIATFYSGPEGYPAWTDTIRWSQVINMKTYAKGKTDYEKFERALKDLPEGGGVLYYPAGTYDFTTKDPGRGLMLVKGVVIRGEAPAGHPLAADGKLDLPTKFIFKFRDRGDGKMIGKVPADWNFIGLGLDDSRDIKGEDHLGIAWVHLVGATVAFGPQVDWGKKWGTAGSLLSNKIKKGWDQRDPSGTHPIDVLAGGGKNYKGGTRGRFVFGCVLDDAAVLDDFLDPGYGPNGFHTSRYCARIIAYGSRILVANNLLPQSRKNFFYRQQTNDGKNSLVLFDYGKTIGIDINKELLAYARRDGTCPGYFEEGIVVRDNYVFNHGHTGYSVSGNWVTITGNHNQRYFLSKNNNVFIYGMAQSGVVTLDGWELARPDSDNRSRAFDLAGRNLWADGNQMLNTGSSPGIDGEDMVCRPPGGTQLYSWALTHNIRTNSFIPNGGFSGLDADCHGLLIGWNQTQGLVGNVVNRTDAKMTDCAFVGNKCKGIVPDGGTIARLKLPAPLTASPPGPPAAPTNVTAAVYEEDAIKITWTQPSGSPIGFRVERRIGEGKWQAIAYRPPRVQGDPENLQAWADFTAPPGKELTYRVVALNADHNDKGASKPTEPVTLGETGPE
jgi:hypothetical protein